ncbi:uncharacterized protein METZ01_LOCUS307644, partial [marine metagenome]
MSSATVRLELTQGTGHIYLLSLLLLLRLGQATPGEFQVNEDR